MSMFGVGLVVTFAFGMWAVGAWLSALTRGALRYMTDHTSARKPARLVLV
jgi:hypothetical protein